MKIRIDFENWRRLEAGEAVEFAGLNADHDGRVVIQRILPPPVPRPATTTEADER